jgi:predicted amino acid dehydrogenase
VRKIARLRSATGDVVEGTIMCVPMLPMDMQGTGRAEAIEMIRSAATMARDEGHTRLGLGAYTSIVTRGGQKATGLGIPVTSGNTLTSVVAVQALTDVSMRCGIALHDAHVAVVGAAGAIGRLTALMLSRQAGKITLVGNAANPFAPRLLGNVAREVLASEGSYAQVMQTTDISAIDEADIILVATSSEVTLVDPARLRAGTIVCDIARPPNVRYADIEETGVFVFDGGLVAPPFKIDLGPFQTLPAGLCWGCLGETMLLALAGETEDFSIGGKLSLEGADRIASLAAKHGFMPARTQWYGRPIGEHEIQLVANAHRYRMLVSQTPLVLDHSFPG